MKKKAKTKTKKRERMKKPKQQRQLTQYRRVASNNKGNNIENKNNNLLYLLYKVTQLFVNIFKFSFKSS